MRVKLKDTGRIVTGNTPKTSEVENYSSNDIPFIKPSDIYENSISFLNESEYWISEYARDKARILPPYSVLVTCIGIIGKVAINVCECAFNQQINAIIPDPKKYLSEYIAYAILAKQDYLQKIANAPVVPIINKTQFSDIEIETPDLHSQRIVVGKLSHISKLIEINNAYLRKLDELIKSRFIEMFGDVLINDMKWHEYGFSSIASSRLGKMLDSKKQTGNYTFPYLANFNVQWFRFDFSKLNTMDFDEDDRQEFELKDGDLLVCEGGEIGRCAIWRNDIPNCYFQKALHRVRCNRQLVIPEYLAFWFRFMCMKKGFSDIEGAKATISHLPGAKLKKLKVVVPPIDLQNQFADFVAKVEQQKATVQKSIDRLEILKKSLMQEYFG